MKVVVTGATGNVGTSVLRALARDERVESIIGVARRIPSTSLPKTQWHGADVAVDDLTAVFTGADAVVHLAWLIQPGRDLAMLRAVNVEGSRRVFATVAAAGVPALVYGSSVGAYSPGPKDRLVAEDWPTEGVATSYYARQKAEVERLLDAFEARHPEVRSVRLRPGLIFKREAASEIRRLFGGPFLPTGLLRPTLIPIVPDTPRLRFQAVHSYDVGEAYRLAVRREVRGAFNLAAEPILDPPMLGRLLGAKPLRVPASVLRGGAAISWRLHLQPTSPGWVDMALAVPLMDCGRARRELGWEPRHGAGETLLELIEGMRSGEGFATPPLEPGGAGVARVREILSGVGSRQ